MLLIGLTGGIGSGKTTVSNLFASLNQNENIVSIIDTDIIARKIVEKSKPVYMKILEIFGEAILNNDGTINRSSLRKIIFSNPLLKKQLEGITHPAIQAEVQKAISQSSAKYGVIVIPLLFETSSNYSLDRVLVVDCEEENQIKRASQRDQISYDDVKLILESQVTREYRLKHADDVISNNGNPEILKQQVEKLHHLYLNLAKTAK